MTDDNENTLVWRLNFAYNNPHREFLLKEAAQEIEILRARLRETEIKCLYWREIALENQ